MLKRANYWLRKQSLRSKFFQFSDLPPINMFITITRSNNRFTRMKNTPIDWSSVARELIPDASRSFIPYVNHLIWTPSCDFASIRWPATLQQVLLKIVLVALSEKDSMNSQTRSVLPFSWFIFLLLSTSHDLSVLLGLGDIICEYQWRSQEIFLEGSVNTFLCNF